MILLVSEPKTKFTFCPSFCRRWCRRARCDQWMFISLVGGQIFLRYKYKWYNLPRNWLVPFAIPKCWWWCFFPCLWPLYDLCATCAVLVLWSWRLKEEINDVAQEGIQLEEHWFQKAENIRDSKNGGPPKNRPKLIILNRGSTGWVQVPKSTCSCNIPLPHPPCCWARHPCAAIFIAILLQHKKTQAPSVSYHLPHLSTWETASRWKNCSMSSLRQNQPWHRELSSVTDYQRLLRKMVDERLDMKW